MWRGVSWRGLDLLRFFFQVLLVFFRVVFSVRGEGLAGSRGGRKQNGPARKWRDEVEADALALESLEPHASKRDGNTVRCGLDQRAEGGGRGGHGGRSERRTDRVKRSR